MSLLLMMQPSHPFCMGGNFELLSEKGPLPPSCSLDDNEDLLDDDTALATSRLQSWGILSRYSLKAAASALEMGTASRRCW